MEGGIWQVRRQGHQDKRQWKARGNQEGPRASVVGVQSQISQFQVIADTPEQNPTISMDSAASYVPEPANGESLQQKHCFPSAGGHLGGTPQAVRALGGGHTDPTLE